MMELSSSTAASSSVSSASPLSPSVSSFISPTTRRISGMNMIVRPRTK